jgi:hypothetical protein
MIDLISELLFGVSGRLAVSYLKIKQSPSLDKDIFGA